MSSYKKVHQQKSNSPEQQGSKARSITELVDQPKGKIITHVIYGAHSQPVHDEDKQYLKDETAYKTAIYEEETDEFQGERHIYVTPDGNFEIYSKDFKYLNKREAYSGRPEGIAGVLMYITLNCNPIGKMAHGALGITYNALGKQGEDNWNVDPITGDEITPMQHVVKLISGVTDLATMAKGPIWTAGQVIVDFTKTEIADTNGLLDKIDFLHKNPALRDFINNNALP